MKHPLREMIDRRRAGEKCGIPSYCTANELALEAALLRAKALNKPVLIEATANQVNQFGGYTGMVPADFYRLVLDMAGRLGVPEAQVILAGDHLGPLTWQNEPEAAAMEKAETLVYEFVRAGFTKIHLDTSMKLADDPAGPLATQVVARRGIRLYRACMQAYAALKAEKPDAMRPVFVIGSEVPIPGGAQEAEDSLSVTKPEAFRDTVDTYKRCFAEAGLAQGWNDVIAIVVQPGVEFGDDQVFLYNRENAKALCAALGDYPEIVFEGHSSDYQTAECLKQMAEDGIAILKVGPALTYGLREALFALSCMEAELVPPQEGAWFPEVLEQAMLEKPDNWQKHYHGDAKATWLARRYSFSDRARYYINLPGVQAAIDKLFDNLTRYDIPMNMLHQYMPRQFDAVRSGEIEKNPRALALYGIMLFMQDYEYATK